MRKTLTLVIGVVATGLVAVAAVMQGQATQVVAPAAAPDVVAGIAVNYDEAEGGKLYASRSA
jgi:hypothetical protein